MNWATYENQRLFKNKDLYIGKLFMDRDSFSNFYLLLDVEVVGASSNAGACLVLLHSKKIIRLSFVYTSWNYELEEVK